MASSFKSKTHFLLVWPHLASKFVNELMRPLKYFRKISRRVSKNAKFSADFKAGKVEKC